MKAEYRKTDVGVVPKDWQVFKVSDACKLINGRGFKPHEWETSGLPIIRIQNLNGGDDFNFYTGTYDKKIEVEPGQLLFAWSGSRGTSFGPHIWSGPLGLLNYHTWKIIVQEEKISSAYFRHALQKLITYIEERAHGASALVHVQKWEMEGFKFPLPPTVKEQEAIAEALSDADALIESLEQLLVKKRQIKQGAMQELLTGKRRLPGFKERWIAKNLVDISNIKTGSRNNEDKVEDGEYPFFVRSASVEKIDEFSHDCEAVLIPGEGGIGSIFHYVSGKFSVHQRVYAITHFPLEVSGKYVYYYMVQNFGPHAMQNSVKATVDSLRLPTFQAFEILLPATFEEQSTIASVLDDMGAEITTLEEKITKAKAIKQGMMQELLTGRIRLI